MLKREREEKVTGFCIVNEACGGGFWDGHGAEHGMNCCHRFEHSVKGLGRRCGGDWKTIVEVAAGCVVVCKE